MPPLPELLPSWASSLLAQKPGAREIVTRLRRTLESGLLASGSALPTSRGLAEQLQVSRSTVVAAYSQLILEGLLEARGRAGTFVAEPRAATGTAKPGRAPGLLQRRSQPHQAPLPAHLDWRLGQSSGVQIPPGVWAQAMRYGGRVPPPAGYGDPSGVHDLRAAIALALARWRGLQISPEHVLVTQGAAQALELLVDAFVRPGDTCAIENPGYPRICKLLARQGATLRPVPVDQQGMQVQQAFGGRDNPALVHITPAHQYPLGVCLSFERRQALLHLARRHRTVIVENEYDHEFVHAGASHPPLFASAPEQVILVGTFAKAVSPALRLGYIVAGPETVQRLSDLVEAEKRHVSWPVQFAMTWLINSGELDRHLRRTRRRSYRAVQLILERLDRWKPLVNVVGQAGGQHVLIRTRDASSAKRLQRQLAADGVALDGLDSFMSEHTAWPGILMSYGHMSPPETLKALHVLDDAIAKGIK